MTQAPQIAPNTASVLCADEYTGMPAMDDPCWQGAGEDSRSTVWEGWAFCYDDQTGRIEAQDEDGNGYYAFRGQHEWEAV